MTKKTNEKPLIVSLKKIAMNLFNKMIEVLIKNVKDLESASALLLTGNGLILGDFIKEGKKPIDKKTKKLEISYINEIYNKEIENIGKEYKKVNYLDSGAMVNLENVVLFPDMDFRKRITFDHLTIFVDQIIGFTIVERRKFEKEITSRIQ